MFIKNKDVLLVWMLQCQFFIVCGKAVDTPCVIVKDELDKGRERFLYRSTSNSKIQLRCTYCSEETRKSSQAFLEAVEEQCAMKNEGVPLKPNLSPKCSNMNPITCIIPNPIENGEWVCPCSGLGTVRSEEVLVYTNCTQQCKPGFDLVGDSFGHCGERWPLDKNFPTEFRYGNAKCVKRETKDPESAGTIQIVLAVCGGVLGLLWFCGFLILFCYCLRLCCFKNIGKQGGKGSNRIELQDIKSESGSGSGTKGTQSTATTSLMDSGVQKENTKENINSPVWKLRKHTPDSYSDEPNSQSWKYLSSEKKIESRRPSFAEATKENDIESLKLSDGEPITGLSLPPENSLLEVDSSGVCCEVHLRNLSLQRSQCMELHVLNKIQVNQKPVCFTMALDIIKCVYPDYNSRKDEIELKLTSLCEKENPIMKIVEFMTYHPCCIGHVATWCLQNGYKSLVPCLVSEEHGKECAYCCTMLSSSMKM